MLRKFHKSEGSNHTRKNIYLYFELPSGTIYKVKAIQRISDRRCLRVELYIDLEETVVDVGSGQKITFEGMTKIIEYKNLSDMAVFLYDNVFTNMEHATRKCIRILRQTIKER